MDQRQHRADGAHKCKMLRHDNILFIYLENFPESPDHPLIGGHAALEGDGLFYVNTLGNTALEITGHGKAQPGQDIADGRADLLEMNHIALGKDAATGRHGGRMFGIQSRLAHVFYLNAHPRCLLVQERAGAGRAGRISGEISHLDCLAERRRSPDYFGAVIRIHLDNLGVLAADFYDGFDLGV